MQRCGRANGHTFDLRRSILGVKIIEVLGYRGGANPSLTHHSPAENAAIFPFDALRVVMLTDLSRLAASVFTIGKDKCCIALEQS